jgi:hypothetical protein
VSRPGGFTRKPPCWYKTVMTLISRCLLVVSLVVLSGQAWATRVVLVSSEVPARVISEEKAKETSLREPKTLSDQQEREKRERLLKELRELYKQGRPEN